jgi:hypothetical protein
MFVKNGDSGTSLTMAILTCVALLCYIGLHAIIGRRPRAGERANEYRADLARH